MMYPKNEELNCLSGGANEGRIKKSKKMDYLVRQGGGRHSREQNPKSELAGNSQNSMSFKHSTEGEMSNVAILILLQGGEKVT